MGGSPGDNRLGRLRSKRPRSTIDVDGAYAQRRLAADALTAIHELPANYRVPFTLCNVAELRCVPFSVDRVDSRCSDLRVHVRPEHTAAADAVVTPTPRVSSPSAHR
jgi:hypothetical protein